MVLLAVGAGAAAAQQSAMSFFVTSLGGPNGADFGGLAGADRHCQTLAEAAGAGGRTWRAYLSTTAAYGAAAVNARDRIGLRDDEPSRSWNSSHPSRGCSLDALKMSVGAGLLYCFAANREGRSGFSAGSPSCRRLPAA